MTYSEEQIKKYLEILHNYKVERQGGHRGGCNPPIMCKL